eukprot:598184-Hanusia_phi.AAC.1
MSAFNRAEHKNDDDLFSHSSSAGNNNLSQGRKLLNCHIRSSRVLLQPAHSMRQKRMNSRFSTHSKEPESEEVELLIQDVYKFVAEACELVWEPEKQVERVYIYAPRFYKRQIQISYVLAVLSVAHQGDKERESERPRVRLRGCVEEHCWRGEVRGYTLLSNIRSDGCLCQLGGAYE